MTVEGDIKAVTCDYGIIEQKNEIGLIGDPVFWIRIVGN